MQSWCALVPQKSLAIAKGRIRLPGNQRRAVATALLRDTVGALRATAAIEQVVVVWDEVTDRTAVPAVTHLSAAGLDLNASLDYAAKATRRVRPGRGVVVVPADLAMLDPIELGRFLECAARWSRAFLADKDGTGTTLLTAIGGAALRPAYGSESATAHAAGGAVHLDLVDVTTLRSDVDDLAALREALESGCGPYTRAASAALGLTAGAVR